MLNNILFGLSFIISLVAFLSGEGLLFLPLALISIAWVGEEK